MTPKELVEFGQKILKEKNDKKKAYSYFEQAAEQGYVEALGVLYSAYVNDNNPIAALDYFEKLLKTNDATELKAQHGFFGDAFTWLNSDNPVVSEKAYNTYLEAIEVYDKVLKPGYHTFMSGKFYMKNPKAKDLDKAKAFLNAAYLVDGTFTKEQTELIGRPYAQQGKGDWQISITSDELEDTIERLQVPNGRVLFADSCKSESMAVEMLKMELEGRKEISKKFVENINDIKFKGKLFYRLITDTISTVHSYDCTFSHYVQVYYDGDYHDEKEHTGSYSSGSIERKFITEGTIFDRELDWSNTKYTDVIPENAYFVGSHEEFNNLGSTYSSGRPNGLSDVAKDAIAKSYGWTSYKDKIYITFGNVDCDGYKKAVFVPFYDFEFEYEGNTYNACVSGATKDIIIKSLPGKNDKPVILTKDSPSTTDFSKPKFNVLKFALLTVFTYGIGGVLYIGNYLIKKNKWKKKNK